MDILLKEECVKEAKQLHERYPVVDAHLDLAGEILIRNQAGEKNIIKNYYLEHWKKAGIRLMASSVYVPTKLIEEEGVAGAWENTVSQIEALKQEVGELKEVLLIKNREDLKKAIQENKIGILLYMEGLDCIGEKIDLLEKLYQMGVRGASLTWSRKNALATGCCKAGEYRQIPGGLTKVGKEAVIQLERLSMFLDVSHLNDDGFADVVALSQKPFLATHSCARAVYNNYRNLTGKQMLLLAQKGGVMGLNGCKLITGSMKGNHLQMLCEHAEFEEKMIGAGHVGFGFDLCDSYDRGVYIRQSIQGKEKTQKAIQELEYRAKKELEPMDCFENHSQIVLLTAALLQRGMTEEKIIQMMGGSMLRYFEEILP